MLRIDEGPWSRGLLPGGYSASYFFEGGLFSLGYYFTALGLWADYKLLFLILMRFFIELV